MFSPVQPMDERLYAGLDQVAQHGGGLPGLLAQHHHVRVDQTEGVYHNLPLDALDGVHHHGHGAVREGLEALLGVDVHPCTEKFNYVIRNNLVGTQSTV